MDEYDQAIPPDLESDVVAYAEAEDVDRATAVRHLLQEGVSTWKRERALDQFAAGEVSFDRAVELADTTPWDFAALLEDREVGWVGDDHLDADLKELS